jgi:hypothetical protein
MMDAAAAPALPLRGGAPRCVYLHEWLHWYLREICGRRAGAETACDRFALRNFRRRQVTVDDALEALQGTRMQTVPDLFRIAA